MSSPFGPRVSPGGIGSTDHKGIDFGPGAGTRIYAVASGIVTRSRWINGYGNTVVINHGEGWTSLYGHMQTASPLVEGQRVGAGTYVGPVGMTGNSTGPHLHLQLELNAIPRDPSPLIESAPLAPATPINPSTPVKKKEKDMFVIRATESGIVPAGTKLMIALRNSHDVAAVTLTAAGIGEAEISDLRDSDLRIVLRDNGIPERFAADYNELGQVHTNILAKIIDARNVVTSTLGDTHANAMSRLKDLFVGLGVTWK